jgi:hypothetical protein
MLNGPTVITVQRQTVKFIGTFIIGMTQLKYIHHIQVRQADFLFHMAFHIQKGS